MKNLLNIKKNNSYLRELLIYGNIPWCITKDIKYIFTCLAPRKNNIFNKFNYHDIITDRGFIKKNISDLDSRYQHCEHCLYFHSCGSFNLQNKAQILKKLKGYKKTFNKKNFLYY